MYKRQDLEQKERSALFVAQIAKSLGADAALVTEEGYGNPDADFTGCIVALSLIHISIDFLLILGIL